MNTPLISGSSKSAIPPSILSRDLRITGNLSSTGDMQIDGIVDGDIKSRTLTLGESGVIIGTVEAEQARISGSITGKLIARSVELSRTAKVFGDIIHQTLSIEAGAKVEGALSRMDEEAKAIAPPTEEDKNITDRVYDPVMVNAAEQRSTLAEPIPFTPNGKVSTFSSENSASSKGETVIFDDVPNPLKNKIRGVIS
ncbi:MAG: polymer-forming cytoskeletal protein [Alphaproteobacteria bacterium]